jgi:hypothetical protein
VCKQLRAYKKNKAGVMISIVGFGRPKFKGSGAAPAAAKKTVNTESKVCPTCGK